MDVKTQFPIFFQKINDIDDRFMKVKIWLMHLGENYNGSYFEKDVVVKAIPSLANTPILGFLEYNGEEEDFSDHRILLEKKDGKYVEKYVGQAYGMIPESNNAKFEFRVGDDGVEREYLTCEGFLWRKWDLPTEIMDRDMIKSQSMELHKDFKGYWNKENHLFHFTDFKFFGACILGSKVLPGMNSASIELDFSRDEFKNELQKQMEDIKIAFAKYQQSIADDIDTKNKDKEDGKMNEKLLELLKKYSLTEDQVNGKFNIDDITSEEELEAKVSDIANELQHEDDNEDNKNEDEASNDFEQMINDLKNKLSESESRYNELNQLFENLKVEKEDIQSRFNAINEEIVELRNYKLEKETKERENAENAIFESFLEELTVEEVDSVREVAKDMTLEEIEVKLFALVGKKNFTKTKDKTHGDNVSVTFNRKEEDDDGYGNILNKYYK